MPIPAGMSDQGLADVLFTQLKTQVLSGNPPPDIEAGLRRLATAIGNAVVDYLTSNAQVHVSVPGIGPVTGTLT